MPYLKNTILNYDRRSVQDHIDSYSIPDYLSKNIIDILEFINSLDDSYFSWYEVQNNDTYDRIAQELYGNADYWDILLVINNKRPLTDLPFDFDTIDSISNEKVEKYIEKYYSNLPIAEKNILIQNYIQNLEAEVEENRILKIINPSKINLFIQKGYDGGYF